MSSFTEKLVVSLEPNGKRWKLEKEFSYYTDLLGERKTFTVLAGFETDFASIPKFLIGLPIFKWRDKFNKASVVHDWLYHTKEVDRKTADRIFLEALLVLEIPRWKAYFFYWAVRLFGWTHWKKPKGGLTMRYLPFPFIGLFFVLSSYSGAVQFSCPNKGVITIWEVETTKEGEVFCAKQKLQFSGSITLPDPKQGEVYTLKCQKPKGGDK